MNAELGICNQILMIGSSPPGYAIPA